MALALILLCRSHLIVIFFFPCFIYNKFSAVAEMGDHLATRHGPKRGRLCPFLEEQLGPHLIQRGLG